MDADAAEPGGNVERVSLLVLMPIHFSITENKVLLKARFVQYCLFVYIYKQL